MKFQEPGALEGELAFVTLHQVAELIVGHIQLQPVAGLKLEGGEIGGVGVIAPDLGPLGYHFRLRRHPGRIVVGVVLFGALDQGGDNQTEDKAKHAQEENGEYAKNQIHSLLLILNRPPWRPPGP